MQKIPVLFFILILVTGCRSGGQAGDCGCDDSVDTLVNDRTALGLHGPVKTLDILYFRPETKNKRYRAGRRITFRKGEPMENDGFHRVHILFNEEGLYRSIIHYTLDSTVYRRLDYFYDRAGYTVRDSMPQWNPLRSAVSSYDTLGRLRESGEFYYRTLPGGAVETERYHPDRRNTYDCSGRILVEEQPVFTERARIEYRYEGDLLKEAHIYGQDGELYYIRKYSYNERGLCIEEVEDRVNYPRQRRQREVYGYDGQDRLTSYRRYGREGDMYGPIEYRYETFPDGRYEVVRIRDGNHIEDRTLYDRHGRVINKPYCLGMERFPKERPTDEPYEEIPAGYISDRCGNWTWNDDYDDFSTTMGGLVLMNRPMVERRFTYYE